MNIKLKWELVTEQVKLKLSETEQRLVEADERAVIGDLDMGSGTRFADKARWYAAELPLTTDCDRLLLDLGDSGNLLKTAYYINGHFLTEAPCSKSEIRIVVPKELTGERNVLLAEVKRGAEWNTGAVERGESEKYIPDGYVSEIEELPSCADVYLFEEEIGFAKVKLDEAMLSFETGNGKKACLEFFERGIFRFKCGNLEKKRAVDEMCIDELYENIAHTAVACTYQSDSKIELETDMLKVRINAVPFGISVSYKNGAAVFEHSMAIAEKKAAGMFVPLSENEHIFGLGENATPSLDKRGCAEDIWVSHNLIHCDVPVPYYISTKGYGLYLNSSYHSVFDMGRLRNDEAAVWTFEDTLDYFFISGPLPKDIVSSYVMITGKNILPPKWAFGFWQAGFNVLSQRDAEYTIQRYEEESIPLDVICIDPMWQNGMCDLKWLESRFPDPDEFMEFCREKRINVVLWTAPFVNPNCDGYEEGIKKGYFFTDKDKNFLPVAWWLGNHSGLVDFTNPKTVRWWKERGLDSLLESGASAFKIDGGDNGEFPYDAYNFEGVSGSELHNLYALYFAKAYHNIMNSRNPDRRYITWERTGFTGSGKYPCTWGGDQYADFIGTQVLIKAGQACGLMGINFWAQDVGGFCKTDGTCEEFFIRSYQWGVMAPLARAHGGLTEPWSYSQRAKEIVSKWIKFRYSLMPYIYSNAFRAYKYGYPIMKPLMYDFMYDEKTYDCDYQYMLGDAFMIAPIYEQSGNEAYCAERVVYIPEGEWFDYETKSAVRPGYITYRADAEQMPMLVRGGAIIPYAIGDFTMKEYSIEKIRIEVYPSDTETSFELYDDDGETNAYMRGEYDLIEIKAKKTGDAVSINIETRNKKAIDELEMEFNVYGQYSAVTINGCGVKYDTREKCAVVTYKYVT